MDNKSTNEAKPNFDFVYWLGLNITAHKKPILSEFTSGEQRPTFYFARKGYLTTEQAYELYLEHIANGKWTVKSI